MTSFYDTINAIKTYLQGNTSVNTVSFGDILKVDLSKQSIFPLANISVSDVTFGEHTLAFTLNVMALDVVYDSSENINDEDNPFLGTNNLQDVLNTQLVVLNGLQSSLRRGELMQDKFIIDTDVSADYLEEQFDNLLAGWGMDITVEVPNTDIKDISKTGSGC